MKKINAESKLELNKSLIGQLNRDNMSRIKGGVEEVVEDLEAYDVDDDEPSDEFGGPRKRTRKICGTSRSARICVSLSPCNGCS